MKYFSVFILLYVFLFRNDYIHNFNIVVIFFIYFLVSLLNYSFFISKSKDIQLGKDMLKPIIITVTAMLIGLRFGILYTLLTLILLLILRASLIILKPIVLTKYKILPLLEKGRYRECVNMLEELYNHNPRDEYVLYLLSKCNLSILKFKEAKKWLDMIDFNKSKIHKGMILAMKVELMFYLGDFDSLEEVSNEIEHPFFKNEALAFIALKKAKNQKYEEALLIFKEWEGYTKLENKIVKEAQKLNINYDMVKFRNHNLIIKAIYNFYNNKIDMAKNTCSELIKNSQVEDEYYLIAKNYLEKGSFPIIE